MSKNKPLSFFAGLSPAVKSGFIATILAGYITHIFAFTNIIPNSDGISRVFDAQQMTVSGRWFLHFASWLNSYLQMPAVIGFLSVVFAAIAAVCIIKLLKIESPVAAALCGIFLTVFPAVAYTYLYMFTASAYFFAVLMAVLAVYLTARLKPGFILGAILLALSIGTYQAYIAVAAVIALIYVLKTALDPETGFKQTLFCGLRQLGMLALGSMLYVIILNIVLAAKGLSLISYQGADSLLGSYPFAELPSLLFKTLKGSYRLFFTTGGFNDSFIVLLNIALGVIGLALLARLIITRRLWKTPAKLIVAVILLAIIPFALNLTQLINTTADTTPVTMYSAVGLYILLIVVAEENRSGWKPVRVAALVLCTLVIFGSFRIDNVIYTASETAHRATESFATRLVSRIEETDGYENGMPVYIIGGFPDNIYSSDIEIFSEVEHYSCQSQSVVPLCKHIYFYLNDWLNVQWEMPSEEEMIGMSDSAEFKKMPLYPDSGSVRIIDGKAVVRLAESYTPKSEFELQYEKRK